MGCWFGKKMLYKNDLKYGFHYRRKGEPTSNPNFSESSSLYDAASTTLLTFWAAFTNCFYENGS